MKREDTRELLQFYRNEKIRNFDAPENINDEFSDIPEVIIDKYNGKIVDRTHLKIEEDLYDENDKYLDYLIRNAIDQTINELCWKI